MSKILVLGDIHLGLGYPNSVDKWFKVAQEYFQEFLLPLAKKELTKDDIIVLLGDLFDNRNIVPINILNYAQYILEELSSICPTHLIIGNHDLYTKSSNDVNTVKLYKYIPNVFVYEEAIKIDYLGKSILMLPWVEKRNDQIELLKKFKSADYLFCHSDLNGAKMHLTSVAQKNTDKIDVEEFKKYKKVYSGHIHIHQVNKNFTFVGSIHEMDRNDRENQKGIFILDVIEGTETFIPNLISPKFKKVYVMNEGDIDSLDKVSTKDYIDLYISNSLLVSNRKLRRKLEILLETGNFASVEYVDDINTTDAETDEDIKQSIINENLDGEDVPKIQLEYKEVIREYILAQSYENEKIKNGIVQEYNEIIKIYDEGYKK
jgi:DNA repair exonuclease SbcCD nuclease subunit